MKSRLFETDLTENKNPKVNENSTYFACYYVEPDGKEYPCLLTQNQVKKGVDRGLNNPEDFDKIKTGSPKEDSEEDCKKSLESLQLTCERQDAQIYILKEELHKIKSSPWWKFW